MASCLITALWSLSRSECHSKGATSIEAFQIETSYKFPLDRIDPTRNHVAFKTMKIFEQFSYFFTVYWFQMLYEENWR